MINERIKLLYFDKILSLLSPYLYNKPSVSKDVQTYFDELNRKLARHMSIGFLILFITLTYAYSFDSIQSTIIMLFGAVLSLFCTLYTYFTRKYKMVFWIYSLAGVIVSSIAFITFYNTIHLTDVLWMSAGVCIAYITIDKRVGFILLIYSLIAVGVFIFHSLNIHIRVIEPRNIYQEMTLVLEICSGFILNFYLFYMFTKINNYSEKILIEANKKLLSQNKRIKEQNDEKSVLIKEVHHRVKNNLQIIVSLLRLQSLEIDNPEVKQKFKETTHRIMSMSLIHRKLYQNESLSTLEFSNYANDLVKTILDSNDKNKDISFKIHSDVKTIGLKSLVPIGLIINELVSNSLKHAFPLKEKGQITIKVEKDKNPEYISIQYRDNGSWKEAKEGHKGFGLTLIESLVEQLDGEIALKKEKGTTIFQMKLKTVSEKDILA